MKETDDILLGPEGIKAVIERVSRETPSWTAPGRYLEMQREALCRAQVAKVWRWVQDNNTNTEAYFEEQRYHPALKYIEVQMGKGDIWLEDSEALRAAAAWKEGHETNSHKTPREAVTGEGARHEGRSADSL